MIVLDTHVWFWWTTTPSKLSGPARRALQSASAIGVSAVSCWELALLAELRRIKLDRETDIWIEYALSQERTVSLALTDDLAVRAALLGREGFHGDPADRMIYATARAAGAPLVTMDRRLRSFDPAGTIW